MNPLYFTSAEITAWVGQIVWPFLRIGAMLVAAPLFGSGAVSTRIRLSLGLLLTIIVVPLLPPVPAVDPLSGEALMIAVQQILVGVVTGFIIQLVFGALTIAGESVAMSMGLGFAQMQDPVSGVSAPVVSQFYAYAGMLIFLALNGHLMLIELIVQSFQTLPIGAEGIGKEAFWQVITWGSEMFRGAVLIALPIVTAMLLINLGKGVISRAAPQLHIFAVGFPVMILMGTILLIYTMPMFLPIFSELLTSGFMLATRLIGG